MTKINRVLAKIGAASASLGLALYAASAHALSFNNIAGNLDNQIATNTNIIDTVFKVINWVLIATAAFAVLFLIIGGFRYVTSAGNEDFVEDAKRTMTYAIFGLIIVLLAFVIAATINSFLI